MSKPNTLPDGSVIAHGQIVRNVSRDGAPKRLTDPAITHGMRDVSATGHPLAFVGGKRPLDDEPNGKLCIDGKSAPIHNGMNTKTPEHRGSDYGPDHGSSILATAGPGSWRDPAHGSQRKIGTLTGKVK
jgi:hypothetical protein